MENLTTHKIVDKILQHNKSIILNVSTDMFTYDDEFNKHISKLPDTMSDVDKKIYVMELESIRYDWLMSKEHDLDLSKYLRYPADWSDDRRNENFGIWFGWNSRLHAYNASNDKSLHSIKGLPKPKVFKILEDGVNNHDGEVLFSDHMLLIIIKSPTDIPPLKVSAPETDFLKLHDHIVTRYSDAKLDVDVLARHIGDYIIFPYKFTDKKILS